MAENPTDGRQSDEEGAPEDRSEESGSAPEDRPDEPGAEGGSRSDAADKLPVAPADDDSPVGDTDQHSTG